MGMDPYGGGDPTPVTFWRPRESERGAYTEKKWGDDTLAVWELSELPADAVVTHVTLIAYRGDKAVVAWKGGVQTLPEGEAQPGESAEAAAPAHPAGAGRRLRGHATRAGPLPLPRNLVPPDAAE